ncbi:hypothetical protein, partial [Aldersonia kunmingensis]|uniref:hypothetical protein n=1 Tax=Aldersonia kunmingensis TaxID=408066 RepID=UPI000AE2453F
DSRSCSEHSKNRCTKDAWRGGRHVDTRGLTEYLKLLADLGYTLAPIEQVITGDRQPDDLDNGDQAN